MLVGAAVAAVELHKRSDRVVNVDAFVIRTHELIRGGVLHGASVRPLLPSSAFARHAPRGPRTSTSSASTPSASTPSARASALSTRRSALRLHPPCSAPPQDVACTNATRGGGAAARSHTRPPGCPCHARLIAIASALVMTSTTALRSDGGAPSTRGADTTHQAPKCARFQFDPPCTRPTSIMSG
eukprot:420299-Pleurochrysis_carterae.AAC.2